MWHLPGAEARKNRRYGERAPTPADYWRQRTGWQRLVLTVRKGDDEYVITVDDIGDRRLSAPLAAEKYTEDPDARVRREAAAEQHKLDWQARQDRQRRPDKRQRRQIVRFTKPR